MVLHTRIYRVFLLLSIALAIANGVGDLECFSCTDISATDDCHDVYRCTNPNQRCYTTAVGEPGNVSYTLGCMDESECLQQTSDVGGMPGLVGRSSESSRLCHQCCEATACNKALCSTSDIAAVTSAPKVCEDNVTFDCQQVSQLFNICGDIHHAKQVCRKWCNLCDLVDGKWALWSAWSECSVTCENGTNTRTRTCTNPPPQHGGLDCVGESAQHKECTLQPCPVHGMWSEWHGWSSCSATCGIGVTRRHRYCDNPKPSRFGQHCFGDGVDFNICGNGTCALAGGWSSWGEWSTCSETCGVGMMSRARACNNPPPTAGGLPCIGDAHDFTLCHNSLLCYPYGNVYSQWNKWLPCEGAIQYRNRTCYVNTDVTTRLPCNDTSMNVQYRKCVDLL